MLFNANENVRQYFDFFIFMLYISYLLMFYLRLKRMGTTELFNRLKFVEPY